MRPTCPRIFPVALLAGGVALLPVTGCSRSVQEPEAPPLSDEGKPLSEVFQPASAGTPTTVVATVDGTEITRRQLDREAENLAANMGRRLGPERVAQLRPQLRKQALENLIIQQLLRQAISNEQIAVSEEEVSNRIAELSASLPPGVTLKDQLARYNISAEELNDAVRFDLSVAKLLEKHAPTNLVASDEEIRQFYEKNQDRFVRPETVRARHILIQVDPDDTPEVRAEKKKKAEEIRQKLLDGADFAEMAAQYSDCPSKSRGGDLGVIAHGQTVPNFEKAAFSQKVGEIGPVVETRFGYHIIQVTDHQPGKKLSLDEVRDMIAQSLSQRKQRQAVSDYIKSLREAADIEYKTDTP